MNEWLGIADASEQSIVARCSEGALADLLFRYEETCSGGLCPVLRSVGEQRLQAGLDVCRDIDDEGGADVSVERGVEDLVGAVGSAEFGG